MKKNEMFSAKSFLTLFSILSMLLIFSLVCAGVLLILNRMDIVYFPTKNEDATEQNFGMDASVSLPLYTEGETFVQNLQAETADYEKLILQAPFTDQFYMKLRITHEEAGEPYAGTYELWCFGDKYRINRYNAQDEVEYMVTCDGERVHIVDFGTLSASYHLLTPELSFRAIAPFPDFRALFENEYEIFEYSETDTFCKVVSDYPGLNMVDETQIYKSTGILFSYKRIRGGKTVLFLETLAVDTSFVFHDSMFEIY